MQMEALVPKIIGLFFKLICWILVFFLILNIVCFLYNFPRLNAIAKLVQNSVEKHGYLPKKDADSIQAYIDAYTYQAHQSDVQSPLNVNKIVSNLKIVVYDLEGNGKPSETNLHNENRDDQYIETTANSDQVKERKKQQGSVLYAGIMCDYLILHPFNGWVLMDLITDPHSGTIDENAITTAGYTYDSSASSHIFDASALGDNEVTRQYGYTSFNTFAMFSDPSSTGSGAAGSLFINPVITSEYYADIEDGSGTGLTN